MRFM